MPSKLYVKFQSTCLHLYHRNFLRGEENFQDDFNATIFLLKVEIILYSWPSFEFGEGYLSEKHVQLLYLIAPWRPNRLT